MDPSLLLTAVLIVFSRSVISHDDYYFKSQESDEYYDTKASDDEYSNDEPTTTTVEHEVTTAVTFARYEVTENIVDVPDTSSIPGPILANFTLKPPLNIVQPNKTESSTDNNDRGNLKKNYISILHINAEYDHPQANTPQNTDTHAPYIPFLPGFRHFIRGLRKGIAQGIHGLVNREHNDFNHDGNRPNLVAAPLVFINKLHRKSPSANSRVHKAIYGQSSEEDC